MASYKPRPCPICQAHMTKHNTLTIWRCRNLRCHNFDRPHYEVRAARKPQVAKGK